jgi:cytochrome d ubiquinol oxidase subunit II
MGIDLPLIWFVIIVFSTMMYVVMDGFDLGIGILFPWVKESGDRDLMMNTVAPVWDGNETWLVLGGAALFGAFPLAYSVILDALAIPLTLMLIGLIFRGVAFEFRFKATPEKRHIWDKAFIWGSLFATFSQGVVVGAVINGFPVEGRTYAGGALDWLTPFALFCGLGLVVTYALLGCTWLVMKTAGELQARMYHLATPLLAILLLVLLSAWGIQRGVKRGAHYSPFMLTLLLVFLGLSGLGISIWPHLIPPAISLWDAAAPPQSLGFMLVGALFIIPIILVYTFWSYYVFRGKISHEHGYH